ncbi:MAG: dolichyl-phosphate beta-glucosyltransferase [Candidatus Paceibacterota bacterium]
MPHLSVIIPAYNEATRIGTTLESIVQFTKKVDYDIEVIVVENNTTDHTREVVITFSDQLHITIIDIELFSADGGTKGLAVKKGMLAATGEYLLYMDADNAVDISQVETFWQYFEQGNDVVFGSRYITGAHIHRVWYRDILGRMANILVQTTLLPGIKDTQCGFKIFTKDAGKMLFSKLETNGWGFDMELLARARKSHYRLKEVPIVWREVGHSTVKGAAFLTTLKELFAIRKLIGKQ